MKIIFCAVLLLLTFGPHPAACGQREPLHDPARVLLLNSYHFGYSWSDSETVGILAVLQNQFPEARPTVEYLDCKYFFSMRHFERQKQLFLEKYGDNYFSAVVVMDNPALEFAVKYRNVLFSKTPVIFCGVNGYTPSMLGGEKNIGGVVEEFDILGTVQLMLKIHPEAKHCVILHDHTQTGFGARKDAEEALAHVRTPVAFHFLEDQNLQEIIDTVRLLTPGTILLALPYTRDKAGRVFDLDEVARMLSDNSPVPVYSVHEAQLGSGIVGGILLGGRIHGEHAGAMAIKILRGVPADSIGISLESSFVTGFDQTQMERHHIEVSQLPSDARIINRPESFYTRNKELVFKAMLVFIGLVLIVIVLSVNIVRRKKAERELRESAQMYKDLIESIPDGVYKLNHDRRFIEVNPAMVKIFGYESKEELLDVDIKAQLFFSPDEAATTTSSLEGASGRMSIFRLRKKDGSEIWVEDHVSKRVGADGRVLYHEGILRDITERVHSERQLQQAQKLEGIGTLAGGIAHDFNNLLAMILGSAELLEAHTSGQPQLKKYVDRIIEATERGTSISRQLLIFSRPDSAEFKPISISHIIVGLKEMLQHFLPKSIAIETTMAVDNGMVMGDAGQIHQALLNLAINAGDAMKKKAGTLTIREYTASEEFIRKRFKHEAVVPFAAVSVSDTGMGMDAATLGKIFEPFFSTKEQGKGTGLGLSIVHGIVKSHQGFIDVESTPGTGTTFTIYIPSIPDKFTEEAKGEPPTEAVCGGTILLVDDEEILRETLAEYLREIGCRVFSASNGAEALTLFMEHPGSIDAVITDLGMPEMGGEELFRHLKKIDPSVAVIVSSGYLDGTTKESLVNMGIRDVLTKPFRVHEIRSVVQSVLDRSNSA
jgi:two-component system, cell cycle sensor histidine kinase and response regulator CckA